MTFYFLIILLYGLPATVGIILIYWIVRKFGKENRAFAFRKFSFYGLAIFIPGILVFNYVSTHHSMKWKIDDKYAIYLKAAEVESFLDWPIDFQLAIEDLHTKNTCEYEFSTGAGPYLQFLVSNQNDGVIIIKGLGDNAGEDWIIDLKNNTINDFELPETELSRYKPIAELTYDFRIEMK